MVLEHLPSNKPDDLADVYIVSRAGRMGYPNVLWRMTVEDAKTICSHPATSGQNWMLCWTAYELIDERYFVRDDGRFDDLVDELGVTILNSQKLYRAGKASTDVPKRKEAPLSTTNLPLFAGLEVS